MIHFHGQTRDRQAASVLALSIPRPQAVVFDYGNTLAEFGPVHARRCDEELAARIGELYGGFDAERLRDIRASDRVAPFANGYRENDERAITSALIRRLLDRDPTVAELDELLEVRHAAMLDCLTVAGDVVGFVERVASRYAVGLLSNYPSGKTIRRSLEANGLGECFRAVVVSGDVGYAKPDHRPFRAMLDALGIEPGDALMVGDNWLADIQGAKRMGMRAAHVRQWDSLEGFEPQPGDPPADLVIASVCELEPALF